MFEKRRCGHARGSTGQNRGDGRVMQHSVVMPDHYRKVFLGNKVAQSCQGARPGCAKFWFDAGECFGFFMEFLSCALVRDCVLAILGHLSGLKEEFHIKCWFLGFWIQKKTWKSAWAL